MPTMGSQDVAVAIFVCWMAGLRGVYKTQRHVIELNAAFGCFRIETQRALK